MTIPQEIVDKMIEANCLIIEINHWMNNRVCEESLYVDVKKPFKFVEKPTGTPVGNETDEWCESHPIPYTDDCYYGAYYYPTEDPDNRYLRITYDDI